MSLNNLARPASLATDRHAEAVRDLRRMSADLSELIKFLRPDDRALMQGIYECGMSPAVLARAIGAQPRTVRDRVRRILNRIRSCEFQFVAQHHEPWPRARRIVGRIVLLENRSMRFAARQSGLTLHRVRVEVEHIRALCHELAN